MGIPVQLVGESIDWPAWVQAVGSILAIAIAIAIPVYGNWHLRQEYRRTILSHGRMIRDAVRAIAIFGGIEPIVVDKYGLQLTTIEVNLPLVLATAKGMPLDRLQNSRATEIFLRLLGSALTFQDAQKRFEAGQIESVMEGVNGLTPRRAAYERVCIRFDELEALLDATMHRTQSTGNAGP